MTIANNREAELKRKRQSLRGKIKRRGDTIAILRHELLLMSQELRVIEQELAEYKVSLRAGSPPVRVP